MHPYDINATIVWARIRQNGMHRDGDQSITLLASEYDRLIKVVEILADMGQKTSAALVEAMAEARELRGFEPGDGDDD